MEFFLGIARITSPHPTFAQLIPLFRTPKMTFYAYERKNTDNDYDGCNDNCDDNFDDNGGNFDDSGDKKWPKNMQL